VIVDGTSRQAESTRVTWGAAEVPDRAPQPPDREPR